MKNFSATWIFQAVSLAVSLGLTAVACDNGSEGASPRFSAVDGSDSGASDGAESESPDGSETEAPIPAGDDGVDGANDGADATDEVDAADGAETDGGEPSTGTTLESCEIAEYATIESYGQRSAVTVVPVPGGGLFAALGEWGTHFFRASDSASAGQAMQFEAFDADLLLGVRRVNTPTGTPGIEFVELGANETVVAAFEWPIAGKDEWAQHMDSAVVGSGDTGRVVLAGCVSSSAGTATKTRLGVWDRSGTLVSDFEIPVTCDGWYWPRRPAMFATAETVVLSVGSSRVVSVDLESGASVQVAYPEAEAVLGFAGTADGQRVAITTAARRLEIRRISDLALLGSLETGVGSAAANIMTYMPSVESPVAFTHDGLFVAHLDEAWNGSEPWSEQGGQLNGRISLRRVSDLSLVRSFPVPVMAGNWSGEQARQGAPMGMAFGILDDSLAVPLDRGNLVIRCVAADESTNWPAPITVEVTGPQTAVAGEPISLSVTAHHADGSALEGTFIYSVLGGPTNQEFASNLNGELETYLYEVGQTYLNVRVTNGVFEGWANLVVDVEPAPPTP